MSDQRQREEKELPKYNHQLTELIVKILSVSNGAVGAAF